MNRASIHDYTALITEETTHTPTNDWRKQNPTKTYRCQPMAGIVFKSFVGEWKRTICVKAGIDFSRKYEMPRG